MSKTLLLVAGICAAGLLLWRAFASPDRVIAPSVDSRAARAIDDTVEPAHPRAPIDPNAASVPSHEVLVRTDVPPALGSLIVTVRGRWIDDDPFAPDSTRPEPGDEPVLPGIVVALGPADSAQPRAPDRRWRRGVADARGVCEFADLAPGAVRVYVDGGGALAAARVEVLPNEPTAIELFVALRNTARGRVVDPGGGAVAGAELWVGGKLDSFSAPESRLRLAAVSDATGRFVVPFRRQEDHVCARLTGFATSRSFPLQQLGDGEVVLVLGRDAASLGGVLVDDIGQPIADAVLSVDGIDDALHRAADGALLGPPLGALTRSDARGAFTFEGLGAGPHRLRAVRLPNRTIEQDLRLTAGEHRELRLTMARRAVVAGRVLRSDGRACEKVHVSLTYDDGSSLTCVTDDGGGFCFEGVALRPFELVARRGSSERMVRRAFKAPSHEGLEVELVYDEAPRLLGTVRAVDGLPLAGWFVTVGEGLGARREPTDADGRFRIPDVAAGVHTLRVHRRVDEVDAPALLAVVTADVATELRVPLDAIPFGEVHGRVVGPDGRALPEARIDMPYASDRPGEARDDGSFRFAKLLPGDHWLRVVAPGHVVWHRPITLAERERRDLGDVVMARSATLRVRFLRPDGQPWREHPPIPWLVDEAGQTLHVPNGVQYAVDGDEVVASGVAAGAYTLRLAGGDELRIAPTSVELRAGDEQRVTVPTGLGRRRTLVFEGLHEVVTASERLGVVVIGEGGMIDELGSHAIVDGGCSVSCVVPVGRVVVEGRDGERVVARRELVVGSDLLESERVAVPAVR